MTLADRVKAKREALGMTQEELAIAMGYKSRVSINKIENGRAISQKIIVRLASALHTTPSYLMGWEEPSPATITEEEQAILDKINALPPSQRKHLLGLLGIEE